MTLFNKLLLPLILGLFVFTLFSGPVMARAKTIPLKNSVEAGQFKTARLANLVAGVQISVKGTVSSELTLYVMDHASMVGEKPKFERALFSSTVSKNAGFSVNVPENGHYYLLVDNRKGTKKVSFDFAITASLDESVVRAAGNKVDEQLQKLITSLNKVFVFNNVQIRAAYCGKANAYSVKDTVIVCAEYADELMRILQDKTKAGHALLFILMHEIGHVLLQQWQYPFYDNEDVVDEFATVLMTMFQQQKVARSQAEYFAALPAEPEYQRKLNHSDRHALSIQRGRNIIKWLDDPRLLSKWQKLLVPNMQTMFIQRLLKSPQPWSDKAQLESELKQRGGDS